MSSPTAVACWWCLDTRNSRKTRVGTVPATHPRDNVKETRRKEVFSFSLSRQSKLPGHSLSLDQQKEKIQMKNLPFVSLLLLLSACISGELSREEWTALDADCRNYAKLTVAEGFGSGAIGNEDEMYNLCVKQGLELPSTLADVRRKIQDARSD